MAWEGMLGTDQEITNRISTATALLLEPEDPNCRLALFRELKWIY